MRQFIAIIAVVFAGCAPVGQDGRTNVEWAAATTADVARTEHNLERDTGINWSHARTSGGAPIFVTDRIEPAAALKAHLWLCGFTWGRNSRIVGGGSLGCPPRPAPTSAPTPRQDPGGVVRQTGGASHYDDRRVLAFPKHRIWNGCAHRTLPAGTVITVRYHGRTTTCVVDDRGPYIGGRVIDLQPDQFADLAPLSRGVLSGVELSW